jgi:threonylcarbamoyladenosine tRNA methylthiotransferase MtaB
VTATADQGARQTIRRLARDNPSSRIVVTGCYATRCEADVASLPNVVQVVRNHDKGGLVARVMEGDGPCGAPIEPGVAGRTAFTLRVQTGCEAQCAYCIIPRTRGAGRSLPIEDVVAEVRRIARAGFKEIALTGVHLGSYGRDLPSSATFTDLMQALLERVSDDVVFRISSLEPMDCSASLLDLMATSRGRIAPHFHLPLQHADDRMLAAMRRPYTLDDYRSLVDAVHQRLPHASIGSDMIVGFPGESDEHFAANLDYLPSSPLTHLHVFPYSDRPGTEATALPGKVDGVTIRERGRRLRQIGADLTRRFQASQAGTTRPGLTLEDGTLVVTDNYLKVRIPPGLARNQRVSVRITEVTGSLAGVVERTS